MITHLIEKWKCPKTQNGTKPQKWRFQFSHQKKVSSSLVVELSFFPLAINTFAHSSLLIALHNVRSIHKLSPFTSGTELWPYRFCLGKSDIATELRRTIRDTEEKKWSCKICWLVSYQVHSKPDTEGVCAPKIERCIVIPLIKWRNSE